MNISYRESERLQELLVTAVLPNGLQVVVLPREGNQVTYASLTVRYGSLHRHTIRGQDGHERTVPDGVQHFLEHMVFARPDGLNAYKEFEKRSADISGFTSHALTSFAFSCVEHVEANLIELLELVQTPYFPVDLVNAERRIIEEEMRMYETDEDALVQTNLLEALYGRDHPLATDVLGTPDSLRLIDCDVLTECHRLFYHPQNSVLLVIGDVQPESLFQVVAAHQAQTSFASWFPQPLHLPTELDQAPVAKQLLERNAPFYLPLVAFGSKEHMQGYMSQDLLTMELTTQLAFEAILGLDSTFQQEMQDKEWIEGELCMQTELLESHGYAFVAGYSMEPQRLQAQLRHALQQAAQYGVSEASFRRAQNAILIRYLQEFDDVQALGARLSRHLAY
ncbi:MAG: EF-P 5-aminopentanol modification-associated protein YfmH, partial [Tumebacillaceae bacterium]